MELCEACSKGAHWDCGLQTWCKCDCAGPDGVYDDPCEGEQQTESEDRVLEQYGVWTCEHCNGDISTGIVQQLKIRDDEIEQLKQDIALERHLHNQTKQLLEHLWDTAVQKEKVVLTDMQKIHLDMVLEFDKENDEECD